MLRANELINAKNNLFGSCRQRVNLANADLKAMSSFQVMVQGWKDLNLSGARRLDGDKL